MEHLKRVQVEAEELEDKINRLATFLDCQVEDQTEEYRLLYSQWRAMRQYLSCLHQRLQLGVKNSDNT